MKKFNFGYRKVGKVLVACAVAVATFGVASVASADTWVANSPESIQLVPGQSTYELKPGDTLWAISQKINSSVEELAQLNGINLLAGEEKRLSVGRQIVLPGADVSTSTVEKNQADEVTSDGVVNTNLSTANVNVVDASSVLSVEELLERVESVEVTDGATYVKLKDGESIDDFVKDLEEATKETPKPVVPGAEEIPVKPLDPIVPETPIDVTKEEPLITDKGEGVTHELPILPIEIVEEDSKEANSGEVTVGKDGEIQKVKKLKENIILYSYMPDGDWTKANGVNFYVSDVKSPNKLELVSQIGSDVIDGRDPSLFVSKDKEIFVAVTKYSKEIGSEVRIYKTNDLLNFESFDLDLGINKITGNSSYYWAPDFFQDLDGKVYLTISAGPNLKNFSQYISEINLQDMSVNNTRKLSLPDDNYIDGNIINDGSQYILSIKNEREKKLELFVSENFVDWNQKEDDIVSKAFGREVLYSEGQYILKNEGVYSIYFDKYGTSNGIEKSQYVTTTSDWETYSHPTQVTDEESSVLRHGSAVVVGTDDDKLSDEVLEVIDSKTDYVEEVIAEEFSLDTSLERVSKEATVEESFQLDTVSYSENIEENQTEKEELNTVEDLEIVGSETSELNEDIALVDNLSQENTNKENDLEIKDGNN